MTRSFIRTALLAGTALALALPALGHETATSPRRTEYFRPGAEHAGTAVHTSGQVPLHAGLGYAGMAVTTSSPEAQRYFDQGMALHWGFNHAEAVRSFRAAQALDPDCAMCFWGEALALGPNINDTMANEAIRPAWNAIARARDLAPSLTLKEQALIAALSGRYGINALPSRQMLDRAWAGTTEVLAGAFPDDAGILVLHADALMNLQPWDYWEDDGRTPKGQAAQILANLERALELAPDHLGALHLYIHAVEASASPERGEAAADRLRALAPATGHLLHMPAHIYARVGRHDDSIAVNRLAIAADEAFLAAAGDAASPLWRYGYFPHNVHYLLVSAQMAGLGEDAIAAARRLAEVTDDEVSANLAWVQAIRTAPYTGHALFSDPDTILDLPDPGLRFPFVTGFWHYARGLAQVRAGRADAARAEAMAIDRLIETADLTALEEQFLPASDILAIARDMVLARTAAASGDLETAEQLVRGAIVLEDGIGYMEPPYWYYPLRQSLGAILLKQDRPGEAVEAFEAALAQAPRNGWALWGLVEAQRAADLPSDEAAATFERAWLGDLSLLSLERL